MGKKFDKFWISQVAVLIRDNKCLILEFSRGGWGLPGGRIDTGEHCDEAFARELKEELDLDSFKILGIVDFDTWTARTGDSVSGIAKLIKNDDSQIKLSHEHTKLAWVAEEELDNYNFVWPNAKRMIRKGFEYLRKYER
jgi:8-oxo-dGTP pyrophosphatase MutT (NUDIX family)